MIVLPENWNDWEIIGELGYGSFSRVYEAARRDDPSVRCAIKVISVPQDDAEYDELIADGFNTELSKSFFDEAIRDFTREIQLMERFRGIQNIVSIEDYKVVPREDGIGSRIFIRMERLTPLEQYISDKKLTEPEVIRIGIDICTALEFCHEQKIIHRDIKPANIFVNDSLGSRVFYKLGDFGIARNLEGRTMGMSIRGTPNYMAPEVAACLPYNTNADLYSLGLTMYWLLNDCRLPFFPRTQLYGPSAKREALQKRLSGEILEPPANGSPEVSAVLLKACAFRPEDRYQTATEMKQALIRAAGKEPAVLSVPEAAKGPSEITEKKKQAGAGLKVIVVLAIAFCLGIVGWFVFRHNDPQPDRNTPVTAETDEAGGGMPATTPEPEETKEAVTEKVITAETEEPVPAWLMEEPTKATEAPDLPDWLTGE